MFLGSAPMSLVGVEVADWLEQQYGSGVESTSAKVIGGALVLGGLGFLAKTFVKRGVQPSNAPFLLANRDRVICVALGASGGFIVGLTSVGSGTFFGLVMLLVFPLTAAKIVGTDIFHAAALLWVAGISHLLHGNVDLGAMGVAPARLDPGRPAREQAHRARPRGRAAGRLGAVLTAEWRQAARAARIRADRAGDARARRMLAGSYGGAADPPARAEPRSSRERGPRALPSTPPGALGEIGEGGPLEDLDRCVTDLAPRVTERVGDELRAGRGGFASRSRSAPAGPGTAARRARG